ncbi:lantibiotic dehydratase, partial [Actinomadura adrarensis]
MRWERRTTPFGTFAGITTATLGPAAAAKFGTGHRVIISPDAEWLTSLIDRIERNHTVRRRLTVVADNSGVIRDGRFIIARRAELGARSPGPLREASVRLTAPIRHVLNLAATPQRFDVLAEHLCQRFPDAGADRVHRLLHGLIDGGFLITGLRPASTVPDPLHHLIQTLHAAGVHNLTEPEVTGMLDRLEDIHASIVQHNTTAAPAPALRTQIVGRMRELATVTGPALAVDLQLNAHITLPEPVLA